MLTGFHGALMAGEEKRVVATQREIDEVKGAHRAYAKIESFNAYSIKDLLKAHALMTKGLVEKPVTIHTWLRYEQASPDCHIGRCLNP